MNDQLNSDADAFSDDERDRLEQELLELHFGCHENPEAIEARLAAEPALQHHKYKAFLALICNQ